MEEETIEKCEVKSLIDVVDKTLEKSKDSVAAQAIAPVHTATIGGEDSKKAVIEFYPRKTNLSLFGLMWLVYAVLLVCCYIFGLGEEPLSLNDTIVRLILLTALFGSLAGGFYWYENKKRKPHVITLAEEGIEFSDHWNFGMLDRAKREWDDVQSVEIVSLTTTQQSEFLKTKTHFETLYGTKLYIDFTSGGDASINLPLLDDQQKTALFKSLDKWVPLTKFGGAAIRYKEQLLSEVSNASYTDLWIDDVSMRHASTNFEPLPRGHLLRSGNLRVVAELASGGLSAVYLVESEDRKTKLVLKESVLPLDMSEESKAKARELFHREAQLLSALDHPNIVKVYDFFVERGRDYLLLQHITGRTLRQVVAEGRLSENRAVELATRIASIIGYLHEQVPPVVHRDLTPDNILVRDDGEVVLIDFGAANQFVGQATGTMVGKKSYIPPEQFRGKAEPASDTYAFGATLFFMLTGKDPIALSTSTVPLDLDLSNNIRTVVEKCTQLEASDRFNSIDSLKAALLETSRELRV